MAEGSAAARQRRRLNFLLALCVTVAILALSRTGFVETLELKALDEFFNLRGPIPQVPYLGTLDIDTPSLEQEGRWPWPRNKHAEMISILRESGVRMVGMDIYFSEPSDEAASASDSLVSLGEKVVGPDLELAEAQRQAGNVYPSLNFKLRPWERSAFESEREFFNLRERTPRQEASVRAIARRGLARPWPAQTDGLTEGLRRAYHVDPPLAALVETARGVGVAMTVPDRDGVARRLPLLTEYDGHLYPALSLAMVLDLLGVPIQAVQLEPGRAITLPGARFPDGRVKDLRIPTDPQGHIVVNWAGPYEPTFKHFSYAAIKEFRKRNQANYALLVVKRLAAEDPSLVGDPGRLYQEALSRGAQPEEWVGQSVMRVVGGLQMEAALAQNPELTAGAFFAAQGLPPDQVPPELADFFAQVRENNRMAELIAGDPTLSVTALAQGVGADSTEAFAERARILRNLAASGGVRPEDRPLFFFKSEALLEVYSVQQAAYLDLYALRDEVLFCGLTATGTHDLNPTPFSSRYQMVGMHLNALNTIVSERFIRQPPAWTTWLLIVVVGLVMGLLTPMMSPIAGFGLATLVVAADLLGGLALFAYKDIWMDVMGPFAATTFCYLAITVNNYVAEEREKKLIRGMFGQYVPKGVVDELIQNPEKAKLGGEETVLTVMFSDVAGFTSISEKLTPRELVVLLNDYLSAMTDIVLSHGGIIDKYEGDLIMAEFGAPIPLEDHARRACFAALDMTRKLKEMRETPEWIAAGRPRMVARYGANSGLVVVGNMGSHQVFDYTVMGDNVNLAARLEPANKEYGTLICISEETYKLCKDDIVARELDMLQVVGKQKPVRIYEVVARASETLPSGRAEALELFAQGLARYREQEWDEAVALFEAALKADPNEGPPGKYIKRCAEYRLEPPPPDWDGRFIQKTK